MAYEKVTPFYDRPDTRGPLSAERLNRMNDGIDSLNTDLVDKVSYGTLPPITTNPQPTQILTAGIIGMDSEKRVFRQAITTFTLERSNGDGVWEQIHTFLRTIIGVRQLDNGEILVGIADDYPANTIKSSAWLSSGYLTGSIIWTKVLEADDYQQPLSLVWGFGGAGNTYVISEYDTKGGNVRSAKQRVWLTQDAGLSWLPIYDHGTGALSNRHIHGCSYDKYRNAIWVSAGDYSETDKTARVIIVSWDMGVSWTVVTNTHQPTVVYVFPECVVFGSDNTPNGTLRIDNPSPTNLVVSVAYKINSSTIITHVAGRSFRLGDGYPLLIPFASSSGAELSVVIASYDGYSWFEMWKGNSTYTAKGAENAIGPTKDGKYFISGKHNLEYFEVVIDSIETSLIAALARTSKYEYYQIPRRAYIAVPTSNSPYTVIPPYTWTEIVLGTIPFREYDPSDLFEIASDGKGVYVKRACIVQLSVDAGMHYTAVKPAIRLTVNGLTVSSTLFDTSINKSIMVNAGDRISFQVWHETVGVDKTVNGMSYCVVLDTWETY